ncbi:hypothetical protein EJB05_42389 [Eragrostis curvula]|uniref:Uncharacterized protein n=1 Tax=Eragrostis curvula TaxID=38414 RepID=A0A5J9TEC3_9POAL|nr:hypothetical protein EJB05_42389 [Eragrostis curvula]
MGYEESQKHLLSLSYHELQCLCKRYNLPANKSHTQLASSLASLLEEPLATSHAPSIVKEVSTCSQINQKRCPYTGRDDDIPLMHAKHHKGLQTAVGEASKIGYGTIMSVPPVPINDGRLDCHGRSSSEPGNAHNVWFQSNADKTTNPEVACEHHGSPPKINGQTTVPIIQKHHVFDNGLGAALSRHIKDTTDKDCGPSDMRSANASAVQFFVISDEGINLVVDLNSSPLDLVEKFKEEVSIPPSEPGNFSSFLSSLVGKDDRSTVLPSGNIVVDIQSKGTERNTPSTNSSLGSDVGDNSRLEPYPAETTTVNTVSSASTLLGTSVEISGYQEGAPVVSSSCLTAEVPNNKVSGMMAGALDKDVLPQKSIDVLPRSERITASLVDASVQPTGSKGMKSPGKTKVSGNICSTQNISVADTNNLSTFSLGDVVRSGSNEHSFSKTLRKQTVDVPGGAQLAGTHVVLMEPAVAMAVERDTGFGDRLSVSSQLARQTVTKLPVTDAQSDASSADHCIAGNFDLINPTSSSAASDNAINPLTLKCGAESAQSHSADKRSECDPEEIEELESMTPPAYGEPPRNILLSLRSASAKKTKPTRRSARLVPK